MKITGDELGDILLDCEELGQGVTSCVMNLKTIPEYQHKVLVFFKGDEQHDIKYTFYKENREYYGFEEVYVNDYLTTHFIMNKLFPVTDHKMYVSAYLSLLNNMFEVNDNGIIMFGQYIDINEMFEDMDRLFYRYSGITKMVPIIKKYIEKMDFIELEYDLKTQHIMMDINGKYIIIDPINVKVNI